MKPNGWAQEGLNQIEGDERMALCEFCGKREGTEIIQDEEGRAHEICLVCDSEMEWGLDLPLGELESDSCSTIERRWKMEREELQTQIDVYLEAFERIKNATGSDEVAAALVDQIGRDARVRAMRGSESDFAPRAKSVIHGDEPASAAQLSYLKRLGVKAPVGISKAEASAMLDQALAGR